MNLLGTKLILFYSGRLHDDDPAAGPSGVSQRKKARYLKTLGKEVLGKQKIVRQILITFLL